MLIRILIFLLWAGMAGGVTAKPVAGVLRLVPVTNGVHVRLALSGPLSGPPRALALDDPLRWAIDLDNASSLRRDVEGAGLAKGARVSQFDPQTVRIVLDLERPLELVGAVQGRDNTLELRFRGTSEAEFSAAVRRGRVVMTRFSQENLVAVPPGPKAAPDLARESARRLDQVEAALAASERQIAGSDAKTAQPPPAEEKVAARAPPPRRRQLVVIDAGHGGKDPGALSVRGGQEKQVTLAIAQAAKRAIGRRGGGIDVRLTRDDDRFLTLGGRVRLARQWGADLFISIHADSAANPDARGASVYTLSDVASDREAAQLAAKENRADLIAGVDLSREDREVTNLLIDLARRDSMNASADFAWHLQRAMTPRGTLFRSQFHRFAGFAVLKNLGVPAVLLETGYLSNSEDSAYLFSKSGQQAIADGIADAVVQYLKGNGR
ncbi:MAG: N-acetylmuramoyl-L-alanine amidase [Sphingomonadaceae bacterium]